MDPFEAIADPVRRDVLRLLGHGPRTAGQVASGFDISRPAVSRHLRVLRETGLVTSERRGRERVYSLDPTPLAAVESWISGFVDEESSIPDLIPALDALGTEVRRTARDRRRAVESEQAVSPTGSTGPSSSSVQVQQSKHETREIA
jgi:DNA-binding transcriptional ArsR family regulator